MQAQMRAGDDYGAMRQALSRRYSRQKREDGPLPALLLIDGGKGQVSAVMRVLDELQVPELRVVGVAKGEGRKAKAEGRGARAGGRGE